MPRTAPANPSFDLEQLLAFEVSFYKAFTLCSRRPHGLLYYNPDNPLSHDSNHAHILDLAAPLEDAVRDLVAFYRDLGLTPRIYASHLESELETLRPILNDFGFGLIVQNSDLLLWDGRPVPFDIPPNHAVRRMREVTPGIVEVIRSEDDGDWTINVLRRHVLDEQFHLLTLMDGNRTVAIASFKILEGYSRVDDVLTHRAYRGQGHATHLMRELVRHHADVSSNWLYLWANNPVAIHMYRKLGFAPVDLKCPHWMAVKG